ncbi:unnamed protein product [Ceutorhynchus assimilis]|uniref:C3H1-type domain-containing protein n=1 Tax=Ceutorhynchus assimilis TaxID=467358 RepID=A0A9N9MR19_9CUCU|nr:unnamed protein product [Ceutorhynchus assimilis]
MVTEELAALLRSRSRESNESRSRSNSLKSRSRSPVVNGSRSPSHDNARRSNSASSYDGSPRRSPNSRSPKRSPNSRSPKRSPNSRSPRRSPNSRSPKRSPNSRSPRRSPNSRPLTPKSPSVSPVRQAGNNVSIKSRSSNRKSRTRSSSSSSSRHSRRRSRSESDSSISSVDSSSRKNKDVSSRAPDTKPEDISDGDMESDHEKGETKEKNELNISHEDLSDVSDLEDSIGGNLETKEKNSVNGNDDNPEEKSLSISEMNNDCEEQLDFEAEDGECDDVKSKNGDAKEEKEEGEEDNAVAEAKEEKELEEGEVSDEDDARPEETEPRPVCRFFARGACTWGASCRFLHPGVTDKGNYTMFDMVRPILPGEYAMGRLVDERLYKPEPTMIESAWERGLRTAKEMLKKSMRRKEQDIDFEEKKMNLSIAQEEFDKENGYYGRIPSPEPSEDLREYVESHLNNAEENFFDSDDHVKCDKVKCINSSADLRVAKVEIAAAKMLVEEKDRLVENHNYIIKLLKSSPQSEVTKHCKQTEPKQLLSTANAVLDTASGGYAPVSPRAAGSRRSPTQFERSAKRR